MKYPQILLQNRKPDRIATLAEYRQSDGYGQKRFGHVCEPRARLHLGEHIQLRREPSNLYDPNATRVERLNGEQIGYLNRYLASAIAHRFDAHGVPIKGKVINLTGCSFGGYSLGVNISFFLPNVGVGVEEGSMTK